MGDPWDRVSLQSRYSTARTPVVDYQTRNLAGSGCVVKVLDVEEKSPVPERGLFSERPVEIRAVFDTFAESCHRDSSNVVCEHTKSVERMAMYRIESRI